MTQGAGESRPSEHSSHVARAASLGLAFVLLASLAARLWYSSIHELSYDETHNLMIAMLANQGYAPYSQIYAVIMPFAVLTMRISAELWGASHHVRLLMIAYGLIGISAVYFLVYRQSTSKRVLAAVLAAAFLSFNPHFFFVSTSINLEAGAMTWGLLSIAAVELYRMRKGDRWRLLWILFSGVLFGLSATFKVFVPFIPGVVAVQLTLILTMDEHRSLRQLSAWRTLVVQLIIWGIGVLAIAALFLVTFDSGALIQQVLASRFALREAIETDTTGANIAEALSAGDIIQYAPLLLGTVVGVIALWRQRLTHAWLWVAWLVLAGAFLLTHDPVRPRHTVMLAPAFAALSGIGLGFLFRLLDARYRSATRWLTPILASSILVAALLFPIPFMDNRTFVSKHPVRQAAVDFILETTPPDACVISKENRLLFQADRLTTPWLSLISSARLFSNLLGADEIAGEASAYDCPAFVYDNSFDQYTPALRNELEHLYALKLTLLDPDDADYPLDVYTVQMDSQRAPGIPLNARLGDRYDLTGYSLTPGPWHGGDTVYLTAFWIALETGVDSVDSAVDYKEFIHLVDENGDAVAFFDHYPFSLDPSLPVEDVHLNAAYTTADGSPPPEYPNRGLIPTCVWQDGQTLEETIALHLPNDLPAGEYRLSLGLYNEADMARLPVSVNHETTDQLMLEPRTIE